MNWMSFVLQAIDPACSFPGLPPGSRASIAVARRPMRGDLRGAFAKVGHGVRQGSLAIDSAVLLADIGGTNARFALADPRVGMPLRFE